MSTTEKLKKGTPVWFRGKQDPQTGLMLSAGGCGTDWFLAVVDTRLCVDGIYCLRWANGQPVGIPFPRSYLVKA